MDNKATDIGIITSDTDINKLACLNKDLTVLVTTSVRGLVCEYTCNIGELRTLNATMAKGGAVVIGMRTI